MRNNIANVFFLVDISNMTWHCCSFIQQQLITLPGVPGPLPPNRSTPPPPQQWPGLRVTEVILQMVKNIIYVADRVE